LNLVLDAARRARLNAGHAPHLAQPDEGVTLMDETQPPRRLASVGAVVAGFLATAILSTATDAVMHAAGVFPAVGENMSDALFALATAYRIAWTIFGGWVTARLAPRAPMRHALILGAIGSVAATAGLVAFLAGKVGVGPVWYPVALVVTALPCVWAGGKIVERRAK
jgi:hypothetical protein